MINTYKRKRRDFQFYDFDLIIDRANLKNAFKLWTNYFGKTEILVGKLLKKKLSSYLTDERLPLKEQVRHSRSFLAKGGFHEKQRGER